MSSFIASPQEKFLRYHYHVNYRRARASEQCNARRPSNQLHCKKKKWPTMIMITTMWGDPQCWSVGEAWSPTWSKSACLIRHPLHVGLDRVHRHHMSPYNNVMLMMTDATACGRDNEEPAVAHLWQLYRFMQHGGYTHIPYWRYMLLGAEGHHGCNGMGGRFNCEAVEIFSGTFLRAPAWKGGAIHNST